MGDLNHPPQSLGGQFMRYLIQRYVDCCRHNAQLVRGQHHHHILHARKRGEIFGMARIGEIRPVLERFFVDRCRAKRRCLAVRHKAHGAGDDLNHMGGMRRIGLARCDRAAKIMQQHGQSVFADGRRRCRIIDHQVGQVCRQMARVAQPENGHFVLQQRPCAGRNFGSDPGRFTAGQDNRQRGIAHFRVMRASARNWAINWLEYP